MNHPGRIYNQNTTMVIFKPKMNARFTSIFLVVKLIDTWLWWKGECHLSATTGTGTCTTGTRASAST